MSFIWIVVLSVFVTGAQASQYHKPYDIPLDLSFEESQKWHASFRSKTMLISLTGESSSIEKTIRGGEILSQWIDLLNEGRSEDEKIRLTNANNRIGTPIHAAKKYGPSTIKAKLAELQRELPVEMNSVIFNGAELKDSLSMDEVEFAKWGRKVSLAYQSAVRWKGMQPWLRELKMRKRRDVRGLYTLNQEENLEEKLKNFSSQNSETQGRLREALVGICINHHGVRPQMCADEVEVAEEANQLLALKDTFYPAAQRTWDSFYRVFDVRDDVVWTSENPGLMDVIFLNPFNDRIANWLKANIEDEFKREHLGWRMRFNFVNQRQSYKTAFLEFQPNVTPHVTGDKIVMDANTPIEEYEVRWTIRHEYGHILKLPDCYVEFYEQSENLMVQYQLDTTDLMCSRAGDMNDRIYEELKRVYYKSTRAVR